MGGNDPAGPVDLTRAGREGLIGGGDLSRMDQRLAVEAQLVALPALGGAAGDITWGYGGAGGILRSDTTANGPVVHFGNNGWTVQGATGSTAISCNTTATPNVQLYVTGVGLRQIAAGAADSGGAGLRTLVVPN